MITRAPVPKSHEANLRKFGLCMRIPPKKLGFRTAGMAAALGVILFAYIYLVFLVTHRICMMQCNPMSRPGKWHQNGRNVSVLLFGSPRFFTSTRGGNGTVVQVSSQFIFKVCGLEV